MKLNSFVLFSFTRNKSFQIVGIAAEGTTRLRTHLPIFFLVVPLMLTISFVCFLRLFEDSYDALQVAKLVACGSVQCGQFPAATV